MGFLTEEQHFAADTGGFSGDESPVQMFCMNVLSNSEKQQEKIMQKESKELIVVRVENEHAAEQGAAYDVPADQYEAAAKAAEKAMRRIIECISLDELDDDCYLYKFLEEEFLNEGIDFERRDCTEFTFVRDDGGCCCDCCCENDGHEEDACCAAAVHIEDDEDEEDGEYYIEIETDLLVVDYLIDGDEDNASHMIFEIPDEEMEKAEAAVEEAMRKWSAQGVSDDETGQDEKVIKDQEELICEELEKLNIPYVIRTYASMAFTGKAERQQ